MRVLAVLLLLFAPFAYAQPSAMETAFIEGRYSEAAALAEAQGSADDLAFAARCLLADAMSAKNNTPPPALLKQAEALARQALTVDERHVEGRLQLAISLSLQARPLSTRQAMRSGLGDEAKALAESVLKDDPNNHYANGFMAVWHIEVRRRGGAIGASVMGASVKDGRALYRRALQTDAGDAATHWQFARALAALNARKYRGEITTALDAALNAPAESALERVMQDRAATLKTAILEKSRKETEKLAEQML